MATAARTGNPNLSLGLSMLTWVNVGTNFPGLVDALDHLDIHPYTATSYITSLSTPDFADNFVYHNGWGRDKPFIIGEFGAPVGATSYAGTATTTNGSPNLTLVSPTTGWANGMEISGTGIPAGATIQSGAGTATMVLADANGVALNCTASAAGVAITAVNWNAASRKRYAQFLHDHVHTHPQCVGSIHWAMTDQAAADTGNYGLFTRARAYRSGDIGDTFKGYTRNASDPQVTSYAQDLDHTYAATENVYFPAAAVTRTYGRPVRVEVWGEVHATFSGATQFLMVQAELSAAAVQLRPRGTNAKKVAWLLGAIPAARQTRGGSLLPGGAIVKPGEALSHRFNIRSPTGGAANSVVHGNNDATFLSFAASPTVFTIAVYPV